MIKIIADSSCDMNHIEGVNFTCVPLTISTDDKSFIDDETLNVAELLETLAHYNGRSYTACPSVDSWVEAFEGGDEIYVVTMTSTLSGTYNSAMVALDMYKSEHPDALIHVFDSLSTGPEMRLIIEKIIELKKNNMEFEDVCRTIDTYMKKNRLFFTFQSLHNLAQNGRINKVLASAIGVLGITIIGTASEEGDISPIGKCRGNKKVVRKLLDDIKEAGYNGGKVRICHVENKELADNLITSLKSEYPDADTLVYPARGLCSYYCERGGIIIGIEG